MKLTPNYSSSPSRPSWSLTISFWVALAALFFTSTSPIVLIVALVALWPHFLTARLARDSSVTWIIRLLIYGFVFAFFGAQPGIGADWIFDARTFNMIGLIAGGEAALELWREPPTHARYHAVTIFCIGVVFLAACNTYDDRYIGIFAPFYVLFTLLALREWRVGAPSPGWSTPLLRWPRGRGIIALIFAVSLGAATHFGVVWQREEIMRRGFQLMRDRRFFQSSGISEQPNLGSTFNLRGGTQRVLRIEGALNDGHLRAAAFDTYSNGRWSPMLSERGKIAFPESGVPQNATTHRARITKLHDLDRLIFAPLNAVALSPALGSSFDWNRNLGPILCEDTAPYSYDVFGNDEGEELGVPLHQGVLCVPLSKSDTRRWLQLPPEIDPRVHELAFELTAMALDPSEKVEAIAEYLFKNNKYSRSTKRGRGDPVSNFILEKKSAHCEYFASATVVLLRASGIPSRYVTGYMAHESSGDETVVRQRDAHAWAEAWIDGLGWVSVDATPPDGTPEANAPVAAWQRWWEKMQDAFSNWRQRLSTLSPTQILLFMVLIIGVWTLERWRIRRKRKSPSPPCFEYSAPENLAALAARFEKVLKQGNEEISPTRPLGEYSHSHAAQRFVKDYNRARFGNDGNEKTVLKLTKQIEALERNTQKGNSHDIELDTDSDTDQHAIAENGKSLHE